MNALSPATRACAASPIYVFAFSLARPLRYALDSRSDGYPATLDRLVSPRARPSPPPPPTPIGSRRYQARSPPAPPVRRATQVKTKKLHQPKRTMRTPATSKRLCPMNPPAKRTESKVSPPTKRMRTDAKPAVSGRSDDADSLPMMNTAAEALEVKEKEDVTVAQVQNISKNVGGIVNRMKLLLSRPSSVPEPTTPAVHLKVDQAADQPGIKIPVDKQFLSFHDEDVTVAQVRNISKNVGGIVNRMKLLLSRPSSVPELTTPAVHLKVDQAADQPGIKIPVDKQFLSFLLNANREQLLGIKCIGKKRAKYIILLRDTSPDLFENMKDFVDAIGFNKIEKEKMMASFVRSPLRMEG